MKILLLAIRSLTRFRLYTFINVLGLALSLTCVIIISRYVYSEITVDRFYTNVDRVCLTLLEPKESFDPTVLGIWDPEKGMELPSLLTDPAIENISVFLWMDKGYVTVKNESYNAKTIIADTNFLKIADYPISKGDASGLQTTQGALITETYARKLFGEQDALGETILFITGHALTITGIIGEPPTKTSLEFDLIIPYHLQSYWENLPPMNLVLVHEGIDLKQLNEKYGAYKEEGRRPVAFRNQLVKLKDIYFKPGISTYKDMFAKGNMRYMYILGIVGFLILGIGLFNFVNVYTIILLSRDREFGIKKIFGGNAFQLLLQLYIELLFMVFIALFIGWMFVEITQGSFESWLHIAPVSNARFDSLLTLSLFLFLPLVCVVYPFIKKPSFARSFFLWIQYTVTICLVVISLYFIKQLNYMADADLGYRTHDIIEVPFQSMTYREVKSEEEYREIVNREKMAGEQIRSGMNTSPLFSAWGYGYPPYSTPDMGEASTKFRVAETNDYKPIHIHYVSEAFMRIFEFRLIEGQLWNTDDEINPRQVVINKKAMQELGVENIHNLWIQPENPISPREANSPFQVIGVVEDVRYGHFSQAIPPMVYVISEYASFPSTIYASINPGQKQEALLYLKKLHNETIGGVFNYTFAEDKISELYTEDRNVASIYSLFAIIAILITSLGLFSISLFDIQQRYKEIAIRKVNGATTPVIMKLLLNKYIKLLLLSFIIAAPVSWLAITKYMENFAYKTAISWWLFAVALLFTVGITLLTLAWQIREAAQTNPAEAIKTE